MRETQKAKRVAAKCFEKLMANFMSVHVILCQSKFLGPTFFFGMLTRLDWVRVVFGFSGKVLGEASSVRFQL